MRGRRIGRCRERSNALAVLRAAWVRRPPCNTLQCAGGSLHGVGAPSPLQHIAMRWRFFARHERVVQAGHGAVRWRFFARHERAVQTKHGVMHWRFSRSIIARMNCGGAYRVRTKRAKKPPYNPIRNASVPALRRHASPCLLNPKATHTAGIQPSLVILHRRLRRIPSCCTVLHANSTLPDGTGASHPFQKRQPQG